MLAQHPPLAILNACRPGKAIDVHMHNAASRVSICMVDSVQPIDLTLEKVISRQGMHQVDAVDTGVSY
jgi:hypothetical protein